MNQDQIIEKRTPSQVVNLPLVLIMAVVCLLYFKPEFAFVYFTDRSPQLAEFVKGMELQEYLIYVVYLVGIVLLYRTVLIATTSYSLTNQRLLIKHGIFNRTTDTLELYRIEDLQLSEPIYLRILGLAHVKVLSTDRINPMLIIMAIAKGEEMFSNIRLTSERARRSVGVRKLEV